MGRFHSYFALGCTVTFLVLPAGAALAQFHDAYAGECTVTLDIPAGLDPVNLRLTRNGQSVRDVTKKILKLSPAEIALQEPLRQGDAFEAKLGAFAAAVSVKPRPADRPVPPGCQQPREDGQPAKDPQPIWDDRGPFEGLGYVAKVIDNFAPAEVSGYVPTPDKPRDAVKSKAAGGVIADYRLAHSKNHQVQFWAAAVTMNGVRTADLNCTNPEVSVLCQGIDRDHITDYFLKTIEHANSLEVHVDPRIEFMTLNADTDVPLRLYVGGQIGFFALGADGKLYESDYFGGGGVVPKGAFRGSSLFWGFGRNGLFASNPGTRSKVRAILAVDLFSGVRDKFKGAKYLGFGAFRGFVGMVIDRRFTVFDDEDAPHGPNSVQTYFGLAFDFKRAVAW